MSKQDYGTVLGADILKSLAYKDITEVKVGDFVTFIDARHLGLQKGTTRYHYRGEVIEINALSATPVKARLQKFDPVTGDKFDDSFTEESFAVNRWAPYETVIRAFRTTLAVAGAIHESEE